jgi:hypothetical protein
METEIFSLYSATDDEQILEFLDAQIRLACLKAIAYLKAQNAETPIFPARLVGELTIRLDDGVRPPQPLPIAPPTPAGAGKDDDRPEHLRASTVLSRNGNFVFWFGSYKGRSLWSMKSPQEMNYVNWCYQQAWLPNTHRRAIHAFLESRRPRKKSLK